MHGLVRCTHWVQAFTCAWGRCDNHKYHNKNPREEIGLGMWMTSCPEAMGWGFWDLKRNSWDLDSDEASWFLELAEARAVWVYGMPARWLSQWVKSWRCTNSQHSKKLCVSLLMSENLKLNKVNKSFVPEPISCFSDSYTRMNIINVLCMWISWSYFWPYITQVVGKFSNKKLSSSKMNREFCTHLIQSNCFPYFWFYFLNIICFSWLYVG